MKNSSLFIFFLLFCQQFYTQSFVTSLEVKGILEDKVQLKKINYPKQDILYLSMHHLGKKAFYEDAQNKIDSLSSTGYFFFLETISADAYKKDDLMKLRKLMGVGIPANGYQKALDLITSRIKVLKDKLILQPPYAQWKLNDANSQNVDANLADMIKHYEAQNGEIILENCDLKVPDITQNTRCRYNKKLGKAYNAVVVDFRNKLITDQIMRDKHQKLVLVYGEGHYSGIKKILEAAPTPP